MKSWEWHVCVEAKAAQIDASRRQVRRTESNGADKWKSINLSLLLKWPAWVIDADGMGNKETICRVHFVPCFPQRALPLGVKVGWGGQRDRNMCECNTCVCLRLPFISAP